MPWRDYSLETSNDSETVMPRLKLSELLEGREETKAIESFLGELVFPMWRMSQVLNSDRYVKLSVLLKLFQLPPECVENRPQRT